MTLKEEALAVAPAPWTVNRHPHFDCGVLTLNDANGTEVASFFGGLERSGHLIRLFLEAAGCRVDEAGRPVPEERPDEVAA